MRIGQPLQHSSGWRPPTPLPGIVRGSSPLKSLQDLKGELPIPLLFCFFPAFRHPYRYPKRRHLWLPGDLSCPGSSIRRTGRSLPLAHSKAGVRCLLLHLNPCLCRTPQVGVLRKLGKKVVGAVLCERNVNGVATIHPGSHRGSYRENPAGMVVCPRGTPVGSTQFSASC